MKPVWPLIAAICFLSGCEHFEDSFSLEEEAEKTAKTDDNKTDQPEINPQHPEPPVGFPEKPEEPGDTPSPPTEPEPKPAKPQEPVAIQPKVTPELLRVVKNWNRIPSSAFPREVTLNAPVTFFTRDKSTGKVMGRAFYPQGRQVVVFGQVGRGSIEVGPSQSSKIRETIPIDQTDLKLVLAYAFELTKIRRAELALNKPPKPKRPNPRPRPSKTEVTRPERPKPTRPQPEKPDPGRKAFAPLFEDVPKAEAVNPNHGKWCVCPSCRKGRAKGR